MLVSPLPPEVKQGSFTKGRGYMFGGSTRKPWRDFDLCKQLDLVPEDYPATGFESAAGVSVQNEHFHRRYPEPEDRTMMTKAIKEQARPLGQRLTRGRWAGTGSR